MLFIVKTLVSCIFLELTLIAKWLNVRNIIGSATEKWNYVILSPSVLVTFIWSGRYIFPSSLTTRTSIVLCKPSQPFASSVMTAIFQFSLIVCLSSKISAWDTVIRCLPT